MQNKLLNGIRLFLFDMDGTLYLGDRLYDFTLELLDTIKSTGRRYLFMTNNSSKSVDDYIIKLKKLGVSATREDFITSSQATAYYLKQNLPNHRLYVCGIRRCGFHRSWLPWTYIRCCLRRSRLRCDLHRG